MSVYNPRGYEDVKEYALTSGVPIPDVLALARQNDPFFCGAPAQVVRAEWFAELWYRFGFSTGVHLRRVHYRLVSVEDAFMHDGRRYENTLQCWGYLCDAGKYARYLGLVPAEAFEDHRNPDPNVFVTPRNSDPTPGWWRPSDYWALPRINVEDVLGDSRTLRIEHPYTEGYDYNSADQQFHVEVWIEKSTMNDVLLPICRDAGVNLVTSLGFQSITSTVELLQRIASFDKPARILYVSDFDPAGDGMPTAVARQLEFWRDAFAPGADVALTPLVLTREQVSQYDLPRKPVKEEDLRKASFDEKYGDGGAVELDALEALYPGVLASIVSAAIAPYRDSGFERALRITEQTAQAELIELWEEATAEQATRLARIDEEAKEIAERYRERLTALADELAAEMQPLEDELQELETLVQEAESDFDAELPERPTPNTDADADEDAEDWLFWSARDYGEQLGYYKMRKDGTF